MKTGYDQFFKNARRASDPTAQKKTNSEMNSPKRASIKSKMTSDDEKILRQLLPKKKKKIKFPWKLTSASFVGFLIALYGFQNHEKFENLAKNIEINFLGSAMAENTATEKTAAKTDEKKPEAVVDEKTKKEAEKNPVEPQDASNLDYLQKLNERKKSLDAREQELAHQEEEIQKQRSEIDLRLVELKELRGQISTVLDDRVKVDDQKVEILVQTYSNMKPPQAAKILESMDEDLAVEILGRMKKKNAADVMNLIKPEKAQMISEKFAGYKRKPAAAPTPTSAKSPVNNGSETNSNGNKN